jgi:hypothetical protein
MLKENDPVVIYETGEVGYVEKILEMRVIGLWFVSPHLVAGLIHITFI